VPLAKRRGVGPCPLERLQPTLQLGNMVFPTPRRARVGELLVEVAANLVEVRHYVALLEELRTEAPGGINVARIISPVPRLARTVSNAPRFRPVEIRSVPT
jgi:hypothetical protein